MTFIRTRLGQFLLTIIASVAVAEPILAEHTISFARKENLLAISIDDRPAATYVWRDETILRPYFANLKTPGGTQVTRNLPPIGPDATDHATMHPGLWLAFGDILGADFWRNKGRVEVEFIEPPIARGGEGVFAVRNRYLSTGKPVCSEICHLRIRVDATGYLINWDSQFSGDEDFWFGDQEEMGLGVRVATPLTVTNGGRITNSNGLLNEKQVWGRQADWCDYSGTIEGEQFGMLLMSDPANFRRSWFHARDYGLLVANPFGANAFTKSAPSKVTVKKGETLRLRFGVLVHTGPIDLSAAYKDWLMQIHTSN